MRTYKIIGKLSEAILHSLPENDEKLYKICRKYVDHYNGENNNDIHTNGELLYMRRILGKCDQVFDVGADTGEWTELALGINDKLNIHCFEPSRPTFARLTQKPWPKTVICNNFGLGSRAEERLLYIFEDSSGINSLYRRQGLEDGWGLSPPDRTETILIETLDHYCELHKIANIDYLKIDVEGHELEVFKGASKFLAEGRITNIQFEYGGCNIDSRTLLKDFFKLLGDFKYDLFKIYPDRLHQINRYDQRLEDFQYQNWIAKKTER